VSHYEHEGGPTMERTVPLSTILSGLLIASADAWQIAIWLDHTTSLDAQRLTRITSANAR